MLTDTARGFTGVARLKFNSVFKNKVNFLLSTIQERLTMNKLGEGEKQKLEMVTVVVPLGMMIIINLRSFWVEQVFWRPQLIYYSLMNYNVCVCHSGGDWVRQSAT